MKHKHFLLICDIFVQFVTKNAIKYLIYEMETFLRYNNGILKSSVFGTLLIFIRRG